MHNDLRTYTPKAEFVYVLQNSERYALHLREILKRAMQPADYIQDWTD